MPRVTGGVTSVPYYKYEVNTKNPSGSLQPSPTSPLSHGERPAANSWTLKGGQDQIVEVLYRSEVIYER